MSQACYSFAFDAIPNIIQAAVVNIPCLVLSIGTLVCLIQINLDQRRQQSQISNMFLYLLVKSMSDTSIFAIDVFTIRYYSSSMGSSFSGTVWLIYFANYVENSLWFFSSMMEIAATLDCLVSICKRFKWLVSRVAFYLFVAVALAFSFGFHSFVLLQFRILSFVRNVTVNNRTVQETVYFAWFSRFRFTSDNNNLVAAQAFIRDVAFLIIIVLLNVFIFREIKKVTKRRIHMQATSMSETTVNTSKLVKDAIHAERKKAWMILATGVNYFCGHILYAIYQIATSINPNLFRTAGWYCAYALGIQLILVSYGTSFILYYFFNTQFKKTANQNIRFLLLPFIKLFKCH